MGWHMLAHRLSMGYDEVQEKTSSSQFPRWLQYFEEEINYFHREDHYWALLICMIHNALCAKKDKKTHADFLLKFEKKTNKVESLTPEQYEEKKKAATNKSKAAWGLAFKALAKKIELDKKRAKIEEKWEGQRSRRHKNRR